jgi:hypothetical protein
MKKVHSLQTMNRARNVVARNIRRRKVVADTTVEEGARAEDTALLADVPRK